MGKALPKIGKNWDVRFRFVNLHPLPPADTCLMFLPTAASPPPLLLPRARVMPAILRGEDMEGGRWNGQARGKIDTFPSDADGFGGEVSIYIRPPVGFKSSALDLRQHIESSGPV